MVSIIACSILMSGNAVMPGERPYTSPGNLAQRGTRNGNSWKPDSCRSSYPRVTREIGELGVKKDRIGKRTRYFGIALRSAEEHPLAG